MQPENTKSSGTGSTGSKTAGGSSVSSGGTKKDGSTPNELGVVRRLRAFYRVTGIDRIARVWLLVISLSLLVLTLGSTATEMYIKRQIPPWADAGTWTANRPIQIHHALTLPAFQGATINVVEIAPDGKRVWIGGDNGLLAFSDDKARSWTLLAYDSKNGCFHSADKVCPPPPQTKTPASTTIPSATTTSPSTTKQAPTATPATRPSASLNKPTAGNPTRTLNSSGPSKPDTSSKTGQPNPASQTQQSAVPNDNPAVQSNANPNGPDTIPPKVAILTPSTGVTVSGVIQVSANASDNVGVVGVQLLVDGNKAGPEILKPPYQFSLDTSTLLEGKHLLTAIARDAAGNVATSEPVGIVVYRATAPAKKAAAAMAYARPREFQGARVLNASFGAKSEDLFAPPVARLGAIDKRPAANPPGRLKPSTSAGRAAPSTSGAQAANSPLKTGWPGWALQDVPTISGLDASNSVSPLLIAKDGRIFISEDGGKTWALSSVPETTPNKDAWPYLVQMGRKRLLFEFKRGADLPELRDVTAELHFRDGSVFHYNREYVGVELVSMSHQSSGQKLPADVSVSAVAATKDGNHLWYVLSDAAPPSIWRSDDIGKNWHRQFETKQFKINDLSLDASGELGFAVGDHGAILGTLDGGDHWYPATRGAFAPGETVVAARTSAKRSWWIWDWPGEWPWERPWRLRPLWFYLGLFVGIILLGGGLLPEAPPPAPEGIANISAGDVPIERLAEDTLHFAPFVRGLSGLIRNRNTKLPLTIAVNGGWGSGKTSLMNMLRFDLDAAGLRTVWFNAWHHQEEPNLLAALLQTVRKDAAPALLEAGGLWYRVKLVWRRVLANPWNTLLVAAIAAGLICGEMALHSSRPRFYLDVALGVKCAVQPVESGKTVDRTLLEQVADILIKLAGGKAGDVQTACGGTSEKTTTTPDSTVPHGVFLLILLAGLWPKLSELLKSFGANPAELLATVSSGKSTPELEAQTTFRETFKRQYRDVTQALLPRRLTIFIDDVDRCKPDKVAEMLEAVNYVVVAGPCAVVMGLENVAVEAGLGRSFKDMAEETLAYRALNDGKPATAMTESDFALRRDFAQQYNRKLLNVVIDVPSADSAQLGKLAGVSEDELEPEEKREREQALADERMVRRGRQARFVLVGAAAFALAILGGLLLSDLLSSQFRPPERPAASAAPSVVAPVKEAATGVENARAENPPAGGGTTPAGRTSLSSTQAADQKLAGPTPSLTPAESVVPGAWIAGRNGVVLGAILLLVLGALVPKLLQGKSVSIDDSTPVKEALKTWSPVIAKVTRTPREYKRLLNRIRYLALAANPMPPERPLWRRMWDSFKKEEPSAGNVEQTASTPVQQVFPEPMLVAAAVNKEVEKMIPKLSPAEATELQSLVSTKKLEFEARHPEAATSYARYRKKLDELETGVVTQ